MPDFFQLDYLCRGNARQRRAYRVLTALGLWPALAEYGPVLAGTVPLGVDTADSDLDVIVEVAPADFARFGQQLRARYGGLPGFRVAPTTSRGEPAVVAGFTFEGLVVEVFGQGRPAREQYAVRHLLVEAAVLRAGGASWRAAVRRLRQQGLKTEPAFAHLLGLSGPDPYEALLTLESWPARRLRTWVRGRAAALMPLPAG